MIDLYTSPTPNGHKISCALEAMDLDYNAILVNLMEGEQHRPDFLEISPNGKIPAIIDQENGFKLAESGAILIYLADKTGLLLPTDKEKRAQDVVDAPDCALDDFSNNHRNECPRTKRSARISGPG